MATKEEKKERAKQFLPTIPVPIRRLTPAGRLYQAASVLAQALIDVDPLNIISDDPVQQMINDPQMKMTPELMEIINDDSLVMQEGKIVARAETSAAPSARDVIRRSGQFSRANLLGRINPNVKRARKKTKTDRNMSKALRMANERFRTKSGRLRKGATQAQIMKYAHKLLKRM